MQDLFIEFLPPWVETNLQPAFYDRESGTVLQQTARMYAKINELVKAVNGMDKVVKEYVDYINNYFNNLDVQDEIDNKLDEMVEDGTLEEIIGHYITDNYVEKDYYATTERAGLVQVGNGLSVNASGVISETPFEQFIDGDTKEYEYTSGDTHTFINYAIISREYKPRVVVADPTDPDVRKTASEIDAQYKPSYMINAGPWNTSNNYTYGPVIVDNEILVENNYSGGVIVAIAEDGTLTSMEGTTPASEVNSKYAVRAWETIFNNGVTEYGSPDDRHPRTFLAQDFEGNYLIGTCGGRNANDTGMNYQDIDNFIRSTLSFNARVIFSLDGGGSSQYLYRGIRQNKLVNNENRAVPNFIVWSSPSAKDDGLFEAQSEAAKKIIENEKVSSADAYEDAWFTEHIGTEHVTMRVNGSTMRIIEGRTVVMNVRFDVGSGGVPAYDAVLKNLPRQTNINIMFIKGLNMTTFEDVVFYVEFNSTAGLTDIHTRFALPEGAYGFSLVYTCEPQN